MKQYETHAEGARALQALLSYQEQSIVSRVLLKNKGGSVTLFAFAEGEGLSAHTTPYEALALAVEGQALVEIAGEATRLTQGELIRLPAQVEHAVRALSPFKMLLIMIKDGMGD